MFRDGKMKTGGEREEVGRPKKRSHQATLVQGNHYLLNTFFEAESIEQEDGDLTGAEVPPAILGANCVFAWLDRLTNLARQCLTPTSCCCLETLSMIL